MSLRTHNFYGAITITDDVVASLAGHLAQECYGVVDMIPSKFSSSIADVFRARNKSKGVRVVTKGDRIFVELFVIFRYGVSISAVADSLKSTVKYGLEKFTGMIVDTIDIHVVGIKL
ncbi:MAG: Asp23/Gls24 family envelope stress response protein [Clostridia bacterium]|nr:Asp23/Gls24 family envelope stress response protein [Clostridia bacterium]